MTDTTAPVQNTNGNGPPRLIAGIIIGLLLLLVLGVAIAIIVLCMVRHRQAEGKYSTTGRKSIGKLHDLGITKQVSVPCKYTLTQVFGHNIINANIYTLADNLVCGNNPGNIEIGNASLLETSMSLYEVPVDATQSGGESTGHNNERIGSTHTMPKMHEYAILEPNGTLVINFLV